MLVAKSLAQPAAELDRRIKIAILGCTGSVGESALNIVRTYPDKFEVVALAAGSQIDKLQILADEFKPKFVALSDRSKDSSGLKTQLKKFQATLFQGIDAASEIVEACDCEVVLAAIVGAAGLRSTLKALELGKTVALANKESLVVAGELSKRAQAKSGAKIIPVDSEHSALFQALRGARIEEVDRLWLTASGGPFLRYSDSQLLDVTVETAVKHPRWKMGPKISIDSATLVNKALELIEAHWLFDFAPQKIEVLIHPQSIVHSLVEFRDNVQIAQISNPDMRAPIAYALGFPDGRFKQLIPKLSLAQLGKLEFEELNNQRFPIINIARQAIHQAGATCAVFNFANEIAVARFMQRSIKFTEIVPFIEAALSRFSGAKAESISQLFELEAEISRM